MRILVLTPDLFFSSRIRSGMTRLGHALRVVEESDAEPIARAIGAANPDLAILDIGAAAWDWEAALTALREAAPELPVLAFGSHMAVDATRRAQELGATRVVSKSEFTANMANLVDRYGRKSE